MVARSPQRIVHLIEALSIDYIASIDWIRISPKFVEWDYAALWFLGDIQINLFIGAGVDSVGAEDLVIYIHVHHVQAIINLGRCYLDIRDAGVIAIDAPPLLVIGVRCVDGLAGARGTRSRRAIGGLNRSS